MKADRKARYKVKIKYVNDCLNIIDRLIPDPDDVQTMALYYALSTAIESIMDIIAMFIKDRGEIPKGDKYNIKYLEKENHIESELSSHLQKCNGLRNLLVHPYNGVDREIVLRSVSDVMKTLSQFIEQIEGYLNES